MPLVIYCLGGRHTHIHKHTDVHTEVISGNQVHAWFRNLIEKSMLPSLYNIEYLMVFYAALIRDLESTTNICFLNKFSH